MSRAQAPGDGAMRALVESVEWRLVSLLFQRPTPEWRRDVEGLLAEVRDPALRTAAGASLTLAEGTYLNILGPGGVVSPREVAYRSREDPGRILADLSGFYEAFAYRPIAEDPIDHAAVEAGFAGYLSMKEAYALERGDEQAVEITCSAKRQFCESHLLGLAEALAQSIPADQVPSLAQAAGLLLDKARGVVA